MPDPLSRFDLDIAREAAGVLDAVMALNNGRVPKEMLSRLKALPAMLQVSGLPTTLLFFASKSGPDALGRAYGDVGAALARTTTRALSRPVTQGSAIALVNSLADASVDEQSVAAATVDALALWLRRLAEAVDKEQRAVAQPPAEPGSQRASQTGGEQETVPHGA